MRKGTLCQTIPLLAGLVVIIEGFLISSLAGYAVIDGIGGVLGSTVFLAGLQLLSLGVLAFIIPFILTFFGHAGRKGNLLQTILNVVTILVGFVVAAEGAVLAFISAKTTIDGFGTLEAYLVAVIAAQLFFLGMAIAVPTILQKKEVGLKKLLVYGGGAAVASSGLVIIGVAAYTFVQGIGGVLSNTVELAGVQLFLIGLAIVILTLLMEFTERLRFYFSSLRYLAAFVVTVEGLVLISFATPIIITGIGGIMSRTMVLSGLGLTLLGLFTLFATGLRSQKLSNRLRRITIASVFALTLLLPMAALTIGHAF
jgi:hypothetical protein